MTIPKEIIAAILATRSKVKSLKKAGENVHDNYAFVSIDTYYEQVAKIATEANLVWRTREASHELMEGYGRTKDRTYVKAKFAFDLYVDAHEAPDYMSCTVVMPLSGPQTTGQLFSYADKVFMRVAFTVPSGEIEGDHAKSEDVERTPKVSVPGDFLGGGTTVPVDASSHPPERKTPPHDADGVILDTLPPPIDIVSNPELPPAQNQLVSKFKEGLPLADTRKLTDDKSVVLIERVFQTFMPLVKTKPALRDWHAENLAAIEKVKKIDPAAHDRIKGMFNERNAQLTPAKEKK